MRSFIHAQPDNQEFIIAWKGKYIIGIKNVPAQQHYDVRYEYANNAVIAHDFFADDPYPGVLTIDASESSDPTAVATFEAALRAFLENVGVGNVALSHVAQLDWWNARAAYYFTPIAAKNSQGDNVTIVDQGAFVYDAANDAHFLTLIDSNGVRYGLRVFNANDSSYLCIDGLTRYRIYEPEDATLLALPTVDAWAIYPNDVLSEDLVNFVNTRIDHDVLFIAAWGFGEGDNDDLCFVNSARDALPFIVAGPDGTPTAMHIGLGTDYVEHQTSFNGIALACPIDLPDLLGFGGEFEEVNTVITRVSCDEGTHKGVLRFHSTEGLCPDVVVSYEYYEQSQQYDWLIEFVES